MSERTGRHSERKDPSSAPVALTYNATSIAMLPAQNPYVEGVGAHWALLLETRGRAGDTLLSIAYTHREELPSQCSRQRHTTRRPRSTRK